MCVFVCMCVHLIYIIYIIGNYKTHIMVNTGVGWDGKEGEAGYLADSHLHIV